MNSTAQPNQNGSHRRQRNLASPRARRLLRMRELDASLIRGTGPNGRIIAADVSDYQPVVAPVAKVAVAPSVQPSRTISQLWHEVNATQLLASFESYAKLAAKHHKVELSLSDLLLQIVATSLRVCPEANLVYKDGEWQSSTSPDVASPTSKSSLAVLSGSKRSNLVEIARWRETLPETELGAAVSLHVAKSALVDQFAVAPQNGQSSALACGYIAKRAFATDDELVVVPTLHLCLSYDAEALEFDTAVELLGQIVSFIDDPNLLSVL